MADTVRIGTTNETISRSPLGGNCHTGGRGRLTVCGAAAVVITPPAGIPMAGYYSERGAQNIHDDLHAKAIVLEAGGVTAALVALDLITTPRDLVDGDAPRDRTRLRVPGASVMISATHSHTGPILDTQQCVRRQVGACDALPGRAAG